MIRGYVAVVSRDLPLSQVPLNPGTCRKATIRLVHNEDTRQFSLNIEGTGYSFKVVSNVRAVDKRNISNDLVRISFVLPNSDLWINCKSRDLEAFVYTVEVIKDAITVLPPACPQVTHEEKLHCVCQGPNFSQYKRLHVTDCDCPFSVSTAGLCAFCSYHLLKYYNGDDARRINNTWKTFLEIAGLPLGINGITVTSYPYLRELTAIGYNLVEIPEALGSLPCLTKVNLSLNRLGLATNWNWLTSPYARENLRALWLSGNELSAIPEPIFLLKNLVTLDLRNNRLSEIPAALGNLKNLREFDIAKNKLITLPGWMYRKERFSTIYIKGNDFHLFDIENYTPQLTPNDFVLVPMPTLLQIAARFIISNRLAFWEYSIPAALTKYLEAGYRCHCGSAVLPDTVTRLVYCRIKPETLAEFHTGGLTTPIAIHCCSYQCYKLTEPDILL